MHPLGLPVLFACMWLAAGPALAGSLVATRLIRATDVIGPGDVAPGAKVVDGGTDDAAQIVGLEARVALYPGRPVRLADLTPAAVVERNQVVLLIYRNSGLTISTDGRAMGRGALGEEVRVMNLASRSTVSGIVTSPATVEVRSK